MQLPSIPLPKTPKGVNVKVYGQVVDSTVPYTTPIIAQVDDFGVSYVGMEEFKKSPFFILDHPENFCKCVYKEDSFDVMLKYFDQRA